MMEEQAAKRWRIVASVAATCLSLACGTNYAYSAWAPQYRDRLHLSATQSNLIGNAGNWGMYAAGIPLGYLVDTRGPRPAALLGAVLLGSGYFPIYKIYNDGPGSASTAWLCVLAFMTGAGSCSAFQAALKTSTLNWPHHRGTATAFPLAAFGLSAVFFTGISTVVFHDDTAGLLLLFAVLTFTLVIVGAIFMRVIPPFTSYTPVPTSESRPALSPGESNRLHRTRSDQSKHSYHDTPDTPNIAKGPRTPEAVQNESDESSSLLSSGPGDVAAEDDAKSRHSHRSHKPDITGRALLNKLEFWHLWLLMGLLCGVGLMTINNIGNNVRALWSSWDKTISKSFLMHRQLMHVSIVSIMSFVGRLLSGTGSDLLVKRLHMSRYWCLAASASIFAVAQLCGVTIKTPNLLFIVSGLSGLAYGTLFGVFPSLVADAFGVGVMSINWGIMTLAPVVTGNLFNIIYGLIYDQHSVELPEGGRECPDGLKCYAGAYWITFASSVIGILMSLWAIRHEHVTRHRETPEHDREA